MVAALLGDKATMPCAGLRTAMWYTDIHANKMPMHIKKKKTLSTWFYTPGLLWGGGSYVARAWFQNM